MFKKFTSNGKMLLIWSAILAVAFLLIQYYNRTTLFLDTSYTRDGYLSYGDYIVLDPTNNKEITNTRSIIYDGDYDYDYYLEDDIKFITSKGIKVGDSLDDFLKAYGDYICDQISIYEPNYEGQRDENYYDTHYKENMSPNDYFKQMIETNKITLKQGDYLTFIFKMNIRGNTIAYSQKEKEVMMVKYYDAVFPPGSLFNPRIQHYSLSFDFMIDDTGNIKITGITNDRYTY